MNALKTWMQSAAAGIVLVVARSHPSLELAFLELRLAESGRRFENVLLARCLEVPGDGVLQCRLVLRDHLRHAIKLLDPPRVGAGHVAGEEGLVRVEQILELVHGGIP